MKAADDTFLGTRLIVLHPMFVNAGFFHSAFVETFKKIASVIMKDFGL